MKKILSLAIAGLPIILCSCATPQPPQAFHNTDNSALVIESLDHRTCQIIQPTPSDKIENVKVLSQISFLPQHQTAVVILENYSEPQIGGEFPDRSLSWFMGLRTLGYEHIVFLKGQRLKQDGSFNYSRQFLLIFSGFGLAARRLPRNRRPVLFAVAA